MKVSELKELLNEYSDDANVQINIADGYQMIGISSVEVDEEYDKADALVLTVNLDDENLYMEQS